MFQESYIRKIFALVGVMIIVALLAYTYTTVKQSRYMYQGPTTISVIGTGEVSATPDIASFSFSLEAKEADAQTAQNKVTEQMSSIVAFLKEQGVEEKDIKTQNHSLSPWYDYSETQPCTQWGCPPRSEPTIKGYQVNEYVTVKVRDTNTVGEILAGVGDKGAMNVSGLSFTIDDDDKYTAQARELAIADAKAKAQVLAKSLGVKIVRMNGYWEEQGGMPMPYGRGGEVYDMKAESSVAASAPIQIQTGENMFKTQVNISYEIK